MGGKTAESTAGQHVAKVALVEVDDGRDVLGNDVDEKHVAGKSCGWEEHHQHIPLEAIHVHVLPLADSEDEGGLDDQNHSEETDDGQR